MKDLNNSIDFLICVCNYFFELFKKCSDSLNELTNKLSQNRWLNIGACVIFFISILFYKVITLLLPINGVLAFYIGMCFVFQYINVLKFIVIILNIISLLFFHISKFLKVLNVTFFTFFILLFAIIMSQSISIYFTYNVFSGLFTERYFTSWLLITILISIIFMGIIAYGCVIYIIQNYEKSYEQLITTFILDFITGTLFTLVVGLKDVMASLLTNYLKSSIGVKHLSQIENVLGISTSSLVVTYLYWVFSLIFCFQLIYRTIKKAKQNIASL